MPYDLHAFGQTGLDLAKLGLYTIDDIERVGALPHYDNAGDHIALAVPVRDAPAEIGAERDMANVADGDSDAGLAGGEGDVRDVGGGLGVPASANHVLGAAHFVYC